MTDTCGKCGSSYHHESDCERLAADLKRLVAKRRRVNWVPAPAYFNLNMACVAINKAFAAGIGGCYLVGSSTERRDYRDVDVRYIMADEHFDRLFTGGGDRPDLDPLWSLLCTSIACWLQQQTGLPVDFQIQRMTQANAEYSRKDGHDRQPLGFFHLPNPPDYAATLATDGTGMQSDPEQTCLQCGAPVLGGHDCRGNKDSECDP